MQGGDHQTRTTASRTTSRSSKDDGGVPISTWVIGTAAFLVVLTAGALFLDKEEKEASPSPAEAGPAEKGEEPKQEKPDPVAKMPKHPLNLTSTFLDSADRATLWNPKAALAGVELVVVDGKPSGAIRFDYGEAIGQAVPGAPLSAKRHSVSYDGESVDTTSIDSPQRKVALPEPNCPLDVAFKTLTQSGVSTAGRVGVLYLHSEKHGRPVWLMTNEAGQANHMNADNCALMRR